jgi:hypothetical protein
MSRYFTHYWQNSTWFYNQEIAADGDFLDHIAGNLFTKRGVGIGDVIYVVTVLSGNLYLCGKMVAARICDAHEAAKYLGSRPEDLWEASEHIVASEATPMRFDLAVPLTVTAGLRFIAGKNPKPLKFAAPGFLDQQTLRGVRELEHSSALELDELLPRMQPIVPAK